MRPAVRAVSLGEQRVSLPWDGDDPADLAVRGAEHAVRLGWLRMGREDGNQQGKRREARGELYLLLLMKSHQSATVAEAPYVATSVAKQCWSRH